jgi:hypothetical protein
VSAIRKLIHMVHGPYPHAALEAVADQAEAEATELEAAQAIESGWYERATKAEAKLAEHTQADAERSQAHEKAREENGRLWDELRRRDRRDAELREVISRYECDPDEWEGEHTTADCLTCIAKRWAKGSTP